MRSDVMALPVSSPWIVKLLCMTCKPSVKMRVQRLYFLSMHRMHSISWIGNLLYLSFYCPDTHKPVSGRCKPVCTEWNCDFQRGCHARYSSCNGHVCSRGHPGHKAIQSLPSDLVCWCLEAYWRKLISAGPQWFKLSPGMATIQTLLGHGYES